MTEPVELCAFLAQWAANDPMREAVNATVGALAEGGKRLQALIARGPFVGGLGALRNADNGSGDEQKELDHQANEIMVSALRSAPVRYMGSEESEDAIALLAGAPLVVAIDPLDGSSNIDTNAPVGTIFSILPALETDGDEAAAGLRALLQVGSLQLAAGYLIYGPQCALVLTTGAGTHVFTLEPDSGRFLLTRQNVTIPASAREYAINASNWRHWGPSVRAYIEDCVAGKDGPRGADFNMRWIASMVAEAHRILVRGGIYLYPRDERKGYGQGRLRLVYEANPIAMLVEQAGGQATNGISRILEVQPETLHQRTPLVFGSSEEVERVARYKGDMAGINERSPLFGNRGLLRI